MPPDNFSIIIPCAGPNKRFKGENPKALAKLKTGETILGRQLRILNALFPSAQILVTCGFQADRIIAKLPDFVKAILVKNYEEVNEAYSIGLALKKVKGSALIVYGDLVFSEDILGNWKFGDASSVWYDTHKLIKQDAVGISFEDRLLHMSFGIPIKWSQLVYLHGRELDLFNKEIANPLKKTYCMYEVLNDIIAYGAKFSVAESGRAYEVDINKDVGRANATI